VCRKRQFPRTLTVSAHLHASKSQVGSREVIAPIDLFPPIMSSSQPTDVKETSLRSIHLRNLCPPVLTSVLAPRPRYPIQPFRTLQASAATCCAHHFNTGKTPRFLCSTFENSSHADLSGLKYDGGPRLSAPKATQPSRVPQSSRQSSDNGMSPGYCIYLTQEPRMV
jgi:hypothetical protein